MMDLITVDDDTSFAIQEFRKRRRFEEKKVKRNKGRFAKKVGSAAAKAAKKGAAKGVEEGLKSKALRDNPQAQVFAKHPDGAVTHVSDDGNTRLRYNAGTKKYDKQQKQPDGSWETTESIGKLAAYKDVKSGWQVADDADQGEGRQPSASDQVPGAPQLPAPEPATRAPITPGPRARPSTARAPIGPGPAARPGATPSPAPAAPPAATAPAPVALHADEAPFTIDPAYPARTEADAQSIQDAMEAAGGVRTPEQIVAMQDYTRRGAYHDMNDCLRTGSNCTSETQQRNAALESAMLPTTEPMTTFRAMTLANLAGGVSAADLQSLVGSEISDPGFSSSGLDPSVTEVFGAEQDSVDLQIEMPAGTRAAIPGTDGVPGEQEVILAPGTRYQILEAINPPPPGRPSLRIQVIP